MCGLPRFTKQFHPLCTHPSLEGLPGVGGFDEVLELDDAVGHEVVVSDGGVVEHGHLDLLPVHHVQAELLVVRRRVGLLLDVSLSDLAVVHLHHDVRVQSRRAFFVDDGVALGEGGGLQVHRLADAELQVTVELHLSSRVSLASRRSEEETPQTARKVTQPTLKKRKEKRKGTHTCSMATLPN